MILARSAAEKEAMLRFRLSLKEETASFALHCTKPHILLQPATRSSSATLREYFVAGNVSAVSKRKWK